MKCVFCSNEIQSNYFLNSQNFLAIYNQSPILPGHSLIIPRQHKTSLMDLSDSMASELMLFSRKTIGLLQKAFQCSHFNWTIQDGESAGQTIMHMHMHIIPRKDNDLPNPGDWYPKLCNEFDSDNNIESFNRSKHNKDELIRITKFLKSINLND